MGAGAMAVRLLVRPHGELRDMRRHDVVRHFDHQHFTAGAAVVAFRQLVAAHVANEVGIVKSLAGDLRLATEEILFAGIAVGEPVVAVKDEIDVVVEIEHGRRIGHSPTAAPLYRLGR